MHGDGVRRDPRHKKDSDDDDRMTTEGLTTPKTAANASDEHRLLRRTACSLTLEFLYHQDH